MKGFIWLFLCSVLFCVSCKRQTPQKEAGLIFYNNYRGPTQLWIDGKEVDLVPLRSFPQRGRTVRFAFDSKTNKLWARTASRDPENRVESFFVDMTDGVYNPEKEISVKSPIDEKLEDFFAYNNEMVNEYYRREDTVFHPGLYGIINLKTGEQRILNIRALFEEMNITRNFLFFSCFSLF